jgi:hypothetical protein
VPISRREYLQTVAGALAGAAALAATPATSAPGIPGPYRGKVVAIGHSGCIRQDDFQDEPIRAMVSRGMCELTGARSPWMPGAASLRLATWWASR